MLPHRCSMAPNKARPGVEAAKLLWQSSDESVWSETLASYPCSDLIESNLSNAQKKLSKTSFKEDELWRESFCRSIQSQKDVTLKNLERMMVWKLRHGQFRPTLMKLIRSNSEQDVIKVCKDALKNIFSGKPMDVSEKQVNDSMKTLSKLKGVGPATASLILSCAIPNHVPFMSDEAMDATVGLPRAYTNSTFEKFRTLLSAKAIELGDGWTPDLVEKALFTAAALERNGQ